jgi:hypothetical protein
MKKSNSKKRRLNKESRKKMRRRRRKKRSIWFDQFPAASLTFSPVVMVLTGYWYTKSVAMCMNNCRIHYKPG